MVSTLTSNGHGAAMLYPIGRLIVETRLLEQYLNNQHATQALLLQMAIASQFDKKAGKTFNDTIKRLTGGEK